MTAPLAAVFGCSGLVLTAEEESFFGEADPLGFILFARNVRSPEQVRDLVDDLRDAIGRDNAPVLIDQEGGRVARLTPPYWREAPPAARFAVLGAEAREAVFLNARLIAHDLADLGITVDCAPVLDLPRAGADPIIGDRAFCDDPETVAELGRAACEGFLDGGVLPVIKHLPGHGRATVDSHLALPIVETSRDEMTATDFRPFAALADMPWAMTAHVVYADLDPDNPATTSRKVIHRVIREQMGFDGVLVSDDLCMKALSGGFRDRARAALEAGCDVALHCNGDLGEMTEVAAGARALDADGLRRVRTAEARLGTPAAFDRKQARSRLAALLSGKG